MPEAVLRIKTEGGAEARELITALERAVGGAQQRMARGARASQQRIVRDTVQATGQQVGAYRQAAIVIERQEQLITRSKLRELAKQGEAARRFATLYADAHRRATAAIEAEVGKRGNLSDRERRQVETLALAMVNEHEQAERRRTAATRREAAQREQANRRERRDRDAEARRFLAGAPSAAASAARRGMEAFANYSDNVEERRQARQQVDLRATQIAAGDIGDVSAASQLTAATRRISEQTGLDPQGVIEAMGEAQASFSALADATSRGAYLDQVLPQLARAAVATGSTLTEMVQSAGEFQRQLGITNEQLPTAISQAIQAGRLGSISFKDQARHMGVIGGAAARFLSSRPEHSTQSLATTNTLFQFAGRAGGGGDMAATRANAFLTNFTSTRGQRALQETLRYRVMGDDGQIVTRRGESQSQAFVRVMEDVYRRTGGNSTRFLNAAAGMNVRGRALGDQLFRDMRSHGGRLTDFNEILNRQSSGTVQNTITAPFEAIAGTEANQRARRSVRDFYGATGTTTRWADNAERQRAELRSQGFVGSVLADDRLFQGVLGATNMVMQRGEIDGRAAPAVPGDTARQTQLRAVAHQQAVTSVMGETGPMSRALMPEATLNTLIDARTTENLARLTARDQAISRGQSPVTIDEASIRALSQSMREAVQGLQVGVSGHDAVHIDTEMARHSTRSEF